MTGPAATDQDKSKYIRTYAKDVAALTNAPAPAPTVAAPVAPPPPPEPVPPSIPTDIPKEEPLEMTQATREVAEVYNAPPVEERKSEILERLRSKLDQSARIHIEEAPPAPPVFETAPEHVAPVAPIPPVSRPVEATASPLHTYASDFADRSRQRQATAFSVLAAEQDAAKTAPPQLAQRKNTAALIGGAVLLILLGAGGVAGAYWFVQMQRALPAPTIAIPSLIFADEHVRLSGSGSELMQALADTAREPLVEGNVLITYLSESTTTPKGQVREIPLAGGALISALKLPAPDILLRNIAPESTVGIIAAGLETRPFFIFRVTSYERTFAGMLAWEATLGQDLALLYPPYSAPEINSDATTITLGTSTPVQAEGPPRPLPYFTDGVVESHDVRVLYDTAGNTLMLYGYAGKDTLVLARDATAFTALGLRLSAGGN